MCPLFLISAGLWDFPFRILCSSNRGGQFPKGKECPVMYEIEYVRGHVEVYLDGVFCFSADTRSEAEAEIALMSA